MDSDLAGIIGVAQGSKGAPEFEAAVLELLGRWVGFEAAFFSVMGAESRPTVVGLDSVKLGQAIARGPGGFSELLPVKQAAGARRGVAIDTDVLGVQKVSEARYFREFAKPLGGRHSLLAYVPWGGQIVATLMLGRTGATFAERDVRRVEALLPALGVARAAHGLPPAVSPLSAPLRAPSRLEEWVGRAGLRFPQVRASVATDRGTLIVRDRAGFREMVACESGGSELVWTRAKLRCPSESGWPYIDLFHVAAALAAKRRNALFVGCGGAVAIRQFARVYPGIAMNLVESDPAVVELARSWFDLDHIPGVTVHIAEGSAFVANLIPSSFDVAVIDAYDATEMSPLLARRPFFAALRRALRPGGAMAFNVIGTLRGDGPVREIVQAARKEFDAVRVVPVVGPSETEPETALRNIVVIATRSA